MTIKHEAAIIALYTFLKEKDPSERPALYDSLAVLIADLEVFFEANAKNAPYMKEKAILFIESCKIVAGLDTPPVSIEASTQYADNNLMKIQTLGQWK